MAEKILIRGVNWIGDAVMTMPAIHALRSAYAGAKISLLVKSWVRPVFEGNPDIDELVVYDDRFKGVLGRLRLAAELRRRKFTKAILFQNAFDAALITFLAGIPQRVGYNRDGRGFLLTEPVSFNDDDRKVHHINYYLNLLEKAGIPAAYSEPWIHLLIDERLSGRAALSGLSRPILGINPGATYGSAKRWFPERFAEVANRFIKDTGGSVAVFGGKGETDIAREIDRLIPDKKLFLAGATSLRELIALISECDVFVTNDSGPMHIAYAVGTPTVAIFGSTSPELTGPAGSGNIVIKKDFSCSPCFERTCKNKGLRCMDAVTSDDVYDAIKKLLPERRAVFFDRDGTLCRDAHYLNDWKDFEIFPEIERIKALKDRGFSLIGITNQSGVYRGLVEESFVKEVNRVFIDRHGFDDFYYCPHGPDEHCSCRKPEPGMLLKARARHMINLRESYVVGDKNADMLLAKAVGAKGILVT
ncbi:MAG: lipopolysaccharide heptosyltransferase II, partial [Nitrospirae bacterium]|nr:lipopolysaccharide heptosyltransferase II [Nitrospirota bacterium]